MNRQQAVNIIKQIFEQCQQMEGKSLKLMPPKDNSALSHTFQIHIQTLQTSDEVLQSCVLSIAKEHNLGVKVKNGWLIIYKPYPDVNEPT